MAVSSTYRSPNTKSIQHNMVSMISSRSKSAKYLEELSESEVLHLTRLLCIHPSDHLDGDWRHNQESKIATIPSTLLRPASKLARLARHFPFSPATAILCFTHKSLSGSLIRQLFLLITAEITTRIRRLSGTHSARSSLAPSVLNIIRRLEVLNSLWMSPSCYSHTISVLASEARFDRVESGCEACILAKIGGNPNVLRDMRAAALSRASRSGRRAEPRLLRVLDAWAEWSSDKENILDASFKLSVEMRWARKTILRTRRGEYEGRRVRDSTRDRNSLPEYDDCAPLIQDVQLERSNISRAKDFNPDDQAYYDDFESELIESYSTLHTGPGVESEDIRGHGNPKNTKSSIFGHTVHNRSPDRPHEVAQTEASHSSSSDDTESQREMSQSETFATLHHRSINASQDSVYSHSLNTSRYNSGIVGGRRDSNPSELKFRAADHAQKYSELLENITQIRPSKRDRKREVEDTKLPTFEAQKDSGEWEDYL